jgi:hypothetical protein
LDGGERASAQVLHRQAEDAVELIEVEHAADVGVVDLRGELRLVEKHLEEPLVLRIFWANAFERDEAVHPRTASGPREVNGSHSAAPDLEAESILPEPLADP